MTNLDRANHMNQLAFEGKLLEAFDTYYHENSVKVEGNGDVVEGKAANREFQVQWLESIEEMHGGGVTAIAEDAENGKVIVESWADCTFKGGGRMKIEEVEVQTWEDGLITHIRFYYDSAKMGG
ncbi:MAG: nuclear transport factor 2 family protein [Balneolaceae bacterium]